MKIEQLLLNYKDEALKHGKCSENDDYKTGNKAYKKLHSALKGIVSIGEEQKIIELMENSSK
ncbi:MAG: hypothetical protein OCD02_21885 [Spirochaetaceae bacterium]